MFDGTIKWYRPDWKEGVITPDDLASNDVRFLRRNWDDDKDPYADQPVKYELYDNGEEPRAKWVVPA